MIREIYMILHDTLSQHIDELILIDLDLQQYLQERSDAVRITPAAYIRFHPVEWETIPEQVQRAVLSFDVTLISSTMYGDDRDITDNTIIDHLAIENKIYTTLMNRRWMLSDHPDYASLKDTENDMVLMETIVRKKTGMHQSIDRLMHTSQNFQAVIFDYSAAPVWIKVMAQLELHAQLVRNLDSD